ncbi:MAG: phosphotransferase [Xanthomonadales bacterium]|nr:phosphotransferase [Xanthomonadales bacterium]
MTNQHLAHGMAGDHTAPDWPPLQAREVAAVLERVPAAGAPRGLRWHSPRPLSAAALVETAHGRLFVKRHHVSVRTLATLPEEHRFARHLAARGIPVPALLEDTDGQTAIRIGDWVYEVQEPAAGVDLYRELMSWQPPHALAHARAAGDMLGRLHRAAADYEAPQRGTHILVARSEILGAADPVAGLENQLPSRPGLADYLENRNWRAELAAALQPWHDIARPRLATLPALWTHGDWHVSNLFWTGEDADATVSSVLDFGLSARNFALFDLATAIERNAIAWLKPPERRARPDIAGALIDGYHEQQPLDGHALELLAALLPLVHVDFALSEVEYFHAITRDPANANTAWHAFLIGHAEWFRTVPGRSMLDSIATR